MSNKRHVPSLQVGILSGVDISFTLNSLFHTNSVPGSIDGRFAAVCCGRRILIQNDKITFESESPMFFSPENEEDSSFTLHAVTIGVNFHWERKEDQVFKGNLKLIVEDNKITVVNEVSIEDYLTSVISSEMAATSSEELLKAHAVISRSWLLAQIEKSKNISRNTLKNNTFYQSDTEIIRWYDREDHTSFDVCADDHCQRYQGITRASTSSVVKVINETYGEVLIYNGVICDTRFYKCCGGVTELFGNVWEPVNHPYLQRVVDNPVPPAGFCLEMEKEEFARKWIEGSPDAFCNSSDKRILSQVLNDYDQETNDFYRWTVTYSQEELSNLVRSGTDIDFGTITDLVPVERGASGRIKRLKIIGTKKTMVIGKELLIRKALSKSHLYSSCFFVEKIVGKSDTTFILHGAGWGHGVGLCQIGAAVMGSKGYSYRDILMHYYRNATLEKRY